LVFSAGAIYSHYWLALEPLEMQECARLQPSSGAGLCDFPPLRFRLQSLATSASQFCGQILY
jgi:hypothetical protein